MNRIVLFLALEIEIIRYTCYAIEKAHVCNRELKIPNYIGHIQVTE